MHSPSFGNTTRVAEPGAPVRFAMVHHRAAQAALVQRASDERRVVTGHGGAAEELDGDRSGTVSRLRKARSISASVGRSTMRLPKWWYRRSENRGCHVMNR